jgi:uncharacterized protein YprB with RNaseH-like and TPR domain
MRQYFARHYGEEAVLPQSALDSGPLVGFECLVSFNGKSYDGHHFRRDRAQRHRVPHWYAAPTSRIFCIPASPAVAFLTAPIAACKHW